MTNSVWVVFPTANPERADKATAAWQAQGYKVALFTDLEGKEADFGPFGEDFRLHSAEYPGYFRACNALAKAVLALEPDLSALVCAADDMLPDPSHTAQEIAEEFLGRFPTGFGVMQPWGDDLDGTDRICGSPWVGREWIRRAYDGRGPLCGEFMHFFSDQILKQDAKALGVLWGRYDLTQEHHHWVRYGIGHKTDYQKRNSDKYWASDKRVYNTRRERQQGAM